MTSPSRHNTATDPSNNDSAVGPWRTISISAVERERPEDPFDDRVDRREMSVTFDLLDPDRFVVVERLAAAERCDAVGRRAVVDRRVEVERLVAVDVLGFAGRRVVVLIAGPLT